MVGAGSGIRKWHLVLCFLGTAGVFTYVGRARPARNPAARPTEETVEVTEDGVKITSFRMQHCDCVRFVRPKVILMVRAHFTPAVILER
jgi:hypothetical protein